MLDDNQEYLFLFIGTVLVLALCLTRCGEYERRSCYVRGEHCSEPAKQRTAPPTPVPVPVPKGTKENSCTVKQLDSGAVITCKDGSQAIIHDGASGADGLPGSAGVPGSSGTDGVAGAPGGTCTVLQTDSGALISCEDGSSSVILNGQPGTPGMSGEAGTSCSVQQTETGAVISCEDGSQAEILNGEQGEQGEPGAPGEESPFDIVELINPCGQEGPFDEILLRLRNGLLIAHYSHGSKQHLSIIGPGTYQTTQGNPECVFTIGPDGSVN